MDLNFPHEHMCAKYESNIIAAIHKKTQLKNMDNISRTNAYFQFYHQYPEVKWAFLASMVSRNAGWNMCDLEGNWLPKMISNPMRQRIFQTYERANWLIFQDAYPQLLLYHYSTLLNRPMFHLLKEFHVSSFMEKTWSLFWKKRDQKKLLCALIINEQNVIENPVVKNPNYEKRVFHSLIFFLQDMFHYNAVLFPTCFGELYGASVSHFTSVTERIDLGKRLADILFHPYLYKAFFQFANKTEHTGSRHDYEQYFYPPPIRSTPFLRATFPVISHHIHERKDWSHKRSIPRKWRTLKIKHEHPLHLTKWYQRKQRILRWYINWKEA
ncbi:DUF2515 domain-containing protein [Cytobacillus sp. Hz8]|uniref:DUF2515 domain-containing protein n=1 Tax=Cytobacillus sp. Hz8 TaxID=3347168 RepID=UPI0035DB7F0C